MSLAGLPPLPSIKYTSICSGELYYYAHYRDSQSSSVTTTYATQPIYMDINGEFYITLDRHWYKGWHTAGPATLQNKNTNSQVEVQAVCNGYARKNCKEECGWLK